jgi:excisionase family DNA binding protein
MTSTEHGQNHDDRLNAEPAPSASPERNSQDQLETQVRAVATALQNLLAAREDDPDRLFTAEELGTLFQLSPRTLKDQAAAGTIAHHRFGKHYRFSRSDIASILQGAQQAARPAKKPWRAA